jgi:hypothetical protein
VTRRPAVRISCRSANAAISSARRKSIFTVRSARTSPQPPPPAERATHASSPVTCATRSSAVTCVSRCAAPVGIGPGPTEGRPPGFGDCAPGGQRTSGPASAARSPPTSSMSPTSRTAASSVARPDRPHRVEVRDLHRAIGSAESGSAICWSMEPPSGHSLPTSPTPRRRHPGHRHNERAVNRSRPARASDPNRTRSIVAGGTDIFSEPHRSPPSTRSAD